MINKILFITLSNFGDVILTLPVLDILRTNYPKARITVMVGPRTAEIFKNTPHIHDFIVYNKYAPLREKVRLFFQLKKEGFDLVVDLRNTLYGALLPAQYRTSPFLYMPRHIRHMKECNIYRLKMALRKAKPPLLLRTDQRLLYVSREDENYVNNLLQENGITQSHKVVIISPATGGSTRRWKKEKFIELCDRLARKYKPILIGKKEDKPLTQYIQAHCKERIIDFTGLTNLAQLSFLLEKSALVVVCDTGILHLASYLNTPLVALFGPSDERRYGPWSNRFKVVLAPVRCRPCRKPDCKLKTVECMREISVNKVFDSIDALLKS